jgi:hypothetical protein
MSERKPTATEEIVEAVGHEETDAHIGPLMQFAVFLAVSTLVIAFLVVGLYKYLDRREVAEKAGNYPMAVGRSRPLPPSPRLQTYPFDDIKQLRVGENRLLEHYSWVDKNAGVVRIPVERAIEILAERGLPHRAETTPPTQGAQPPTAAPMEPSQSPPSRRP